MFRETSEPLFFAFLRFYDNAIYNFFSLFLSLTDEVSCSYKFTLALTLLSITRNSSEDEIANVNLLYDDIVHVLQNTIDSCINSATA